jgi:hypothetical protein
MNLAASFNLLNLSRRADQAQAKKAYKAQVRRWHPDQFPEGSATKAKAEERLKQVNLAYARIKAHLAASRPTPGIDVTAAPCHQPKQDAAGNRPHNEDSANHRSWINHLFNTLNRVAGMCSDKPSRSAPGMSVSEPAKRFQQVLDEMAGGSFPSDAVHQVGAADVCVRRTAADYRRYRRSGAAIGAVGGADHPGPVKPVNRVRGIGRSR